MAVARRLPLDPEAPEWVQTGTRLLLRGAEPGQWRPGEHSTIVHVEHTVDSEGTIWTLVDVRQPGYGGPPMTVRYRLRQFLEMFTPADQEAAPARPASRPVRPPPDPDPDLPGWVETRGLVQHLGSGSRHYVTGITHEMTSDGRRRIQVDVQVDRDHYRYDLARFLAEFGPGRLTEEVTPQRVARMAVPPPVPRAMPEPPRTAYDHLLDD